MNLPSIKTLTTIAHERAKELRTVLEATTRQQVEDLLDLPTDAGKLRYPVTRAWYWSCCNPMPLGLAKMSIASEITECHGLETIEAGKGAKSPKILYANTGDSYGTTLMLVSGRGYRVGCWADIVERGNYA